MEANDSEGGQKPANRGWVKMQRGEDINELIATSPLAFTLAAVIALRARYRHGTNLRGLSPGEACLGDYAACGMSQQEYRTAKKNLEGWGFATFKATNRGTVARLIDTRLFDVLSALGNEQVNEQTTGKQRTKNEQTTTKKKVRRKEGEYDSKETGVVQRPLSSRPGSVASVVEFALLKKYEPSQVRQWLDATDFDKPAQNILDALREDNEVAKELLLWAFRFLHYNNRHGWQLQHNWRSAFDGFIEICDHGSGPADTPIDWIPHIAGVGGWPEDECVHQPNGRLKEN